MRMFKKITLISFVLANIAVILWLWSQTSGSMLSLPWSVGSPAVAWGRVAGLLLQFTLLIQLVIIGRITWIEQSFGHDGLNRAHRFIGYALVALLIAHPLFLSIGYGLMQSKGLVPAFVGLATQWDDVLNAVIATLLFVGVVALSVPWVRRRLKYEYWHLAHLLTYAAIALSFGHQMSGGDFRSGALSVYWYLINFGIFGLYFLYRFLRPLVVYAQHRFVVERVERVSPDAWSIVVTGRSMASFLFRAGQFATLQFAARGLWTPHPFSFSREYDGRTIRFTVKELGDATRHIEALRPGTPVLVDGPLGVFTPELASTQKYLLIAGGIGITPIRAMAGELMARGADVAVLYAVRNMQHASLADELRAMGVPMMLFVSEEGAEIPSGATPGAIDSASMQRYVPDVASRDVFVCGPPGMMDAITSAAMVAGVPRGHIHSERFGYGTAKESASLARSALGALLFLGAGVGLGWLLFSAPSSSMTTNDALPSVSSTPPVVTLLPGSSGVPTTATPIPSIAPTTTPSSLPAGTYSMADVAKHATKASCWTAVNGVVYDVSSYFGSHPGGSGSISMMCGIDASSLYDGQHGTARRPASELAGFKIGVLAK